MRKTLKCLAFLLFVFTFLSCVSSRETILPKSFNKLEGKWQLENSNTFEIWKKYDSVFIGSVVKVKNLDTTILENLRILKINTDIFYEATVISQNHALPILFKLVHQENNVFSFENDKHDFPKKINYNLQNEKILAATISGNDKTISFSYLKIE